MLRGLTQNQKILLGAGAAALAYYGFRKTRVAATAPREQVYSSGRVNPTIPDKLGNAADIAKTHATAAADDVSRMRQESAAGGTSITAHARQAGRDIAQTGREIGAALSGEKVEKAIVRETPLQGPGLRDNTREVDPRRVVKADGFEGETGKIDGSSDGYYRPSGSYSGGAYSGAYSEGRRVAADDFGAAPGPDTIDPVKRKIGGVSSSLS